MTLARDSYKAVFDFSAYGTSNQSVQSFVLVSQSNIIITNFTVSPSLSQCRLPAGLHGQRPERRRARIRPIGMNIIITGPQSFTVTESASPLSPGQSEILTFVLSNVTGAAGDYSASTYATFIYNNAAIESNLLNAAGYAAARAVTGRATLADIGHHGHTETPVHAGALLLLARAGLDRSNIAGTSGPGEWEHNRQSRSAAGVRQHIRRLGSQHLPCSQRERVCAAGLIPAT